MSSNRLVEDENYWESKVRGFGFGEDDDSIEDDSVFFGVSREREAANKVNQELRAELGSLHSFVSDGSGDEITTGQESLKNKDLPPFLWNDVGLESVLERDRPMGSISSQDIFRDTLGTSHLPTVDETILQLLGNKENVMLEHFRSLSQKKQLLSKAVEMNDGNAILAVVLFLYKTLKHSIFRHILVENKVAANHYIHYLEKRNEINLVVDIMTMLGRTKDALLIRYKQILRRENNLQSFIKEMDHFDVAECQLSNEDVAPLITQHLQLLRLQRELRENDFIPIDHSSVLKTLAFVAENFYDSKSGAVDNIREKFNLNVKQYTWAVLGALVVQQKWPQIENLLLTRKGWLSREKDKCLLPAEDVCLTLTDAPVSLITTFVRLIEDTQKRLALAKKLKCHEVVIDVYAAEKDRTSILAYKSNLENNSKEDVYAERTLKDSTMKWKN